ncbi:Do family serine endopeptidase [Hyphomonas sp.]|uniref:Do family serine endopeptidase n=2 Tax=Hyphomonas sp. TaxID=87 RepID=UPI00300165C5|eukprot:TRINITY_DN2086_c0_g1_i1.p1 TRINITY_DN2086_c0_g1~~TRINITY_DN2086_c0_g1_i1.p1  ORF type:complete len:475 (-),score=91.06 TRINITY_DN2086_c0_g1_i1:1323-2747(-)
MIHTLRMTKHVSKFLVIAGLSVLALLVVAFMPLFAHAQRLPQSQAEIDLSFAPLVREASPAVVNVFTERMVANRVSPMEQLFFGDAIPKQRRQNSLGSGVIVGSDGVIVTNNHVIDGADTFRVVLSDRREYPAELVLADERTDLAVLKIDTEGAVLPVLPYADTRAAEVGDLVLAIGNPFGVGQTVTSGIISATARTDVGISDYAFFLQTDAAVNPGNSGGALVNTKGELVGVNTAIFSRSGGSNGIGFAIPAEMVKRVVDAAMNEGTFVRPWLGLAAQSVSYDIAKAQGLDRPVGVMVTEVYDDGPADRSGLRRGDLVTAIDGREVFDEKGLKFLAAVRSPGDEAFLTVLRGGKTQNIGVTVEPPPGAREADIVLLDGRTAFSGARVVELSPRLAEENGLDPFQKGSGIYVHSVMRRSIARNFFRPGDIVRSVNGIQTKTVDELKSALSAGKESSWDIEIERNGRIVRGTVRL